MFDRICKYPRSSHLCKHDTPGLNAQPHPRIDASLQVYKEGIHVHTLPCKRTRPKALWLLQLLRTTKLREPIDPKVLDQAVDARLHFCNWTACPHSVCFPALKLCIALLPPKFTLNKSNPSQKEEKIHADHKTCAPVSSQASNSPVARSGPSAWKASSLSDAPKEFLGAASQDFSVLQLDLHA